MTAPRAVFFGFSSPLPRFQFVVTSATAIYSLAVGALFSCSGLRDYYHPRMRLQRALWTQGCPGVIFLVS
jgi:hypothetical protein